MPSTSSHLPIPGPLWGPYPENPEPWSERPAPLRHLDRLAFSLRAKWPTPNPTSWLAAIAHRQKHWQAFDEDALSLAIRSLRATLQRDGLTASSTVDALSCLSEVLQRTRGLSPFPQQLIGARIVIEGGFAEMATGEGKTLTVALAAACGAMAGMPVHVMTANDYLVTRDAQSFAPFYERLGLSVGIVTAPTGIDIRRTAYACDVTYCTAKEIVFDYLRDELVRPRPRLRWHAEQLLSASSPTTLRGLCMGILDEADSILIDEAKVPLILAQAQDSDREIAARREAMALARGLRETTDFSIDRTNRQAALTEGGQDKIQRIAERLGAVWRNAQHRETHVAQALVALHAVVRDVDYLVATNGVQIIDPTTGRLATGRQWSQGLHQMIELKEGLPPTPLTSPLSALTYQRFFPRYVRLGGLSGTLRESAGELYATYGRPTWPVPLHRPCLRTELPFRLFADHASLWESVAQRVAALQHRGRPVLIGTESVAESEALSAVLTTHGLPHVVLNARNDASEAEIVAQAGQGGQITVATNMAGRGTDILLGEGVAERGGLHVINCQLNRARRIDRQLIGRCARQGDPGSVETWLSFDNALLRESCPSAIRHWLANRKQPAKPRYLGRLIALLQHFSERSDRMARQRLLDHDRHLDRQLAFASGSR